jgi:XTP/dITP diphosphohydrolase
LLIVLATSPRVAPGLLSWPAWEALRSASSVLAPPGHPQLPALDEAGIAYRAVDEPEVEPLDPDQVVVWLPEPGADPPVPPGARLLRGSADLPGAHLVDLVATMDRLRVECPWDARQTHASLAPHLLEEPYEALEAFESGDEQAFREELGDVLLQVVFHARIAAERDDGTEFTIDDVADGIVAKLVRRHPHVFGDVAVSGADEVKRNWDAIKAEEKRALAERHGRDDAGRAAPSALDGVPFGQPALALAAQLQRRAARAGVPDELAHLDGEDGAGGPDTPGRDLGRQLFQLVARTRELGCDPEMELRAAARRYRDRVCAWERSSHLRALVPDVREVFRFQNQACSGEAAFEEAGLVLDLLALPDGLDQVGEAGGGETSQHARLSTDQIPPTGLRSSGA